MEFFSINRNLPWDSRPFLPARASQMRSFEKTCLFQSNVGIPLYMAKQVPRTTGYPSSRKSPWTILKNHPTNRPMWSSPKENSPCDTNSEKARPILSLEFGSVAAPFALCPTCPVNRSAHLSRDELKTDKMGSSTGKGWQRAKSMVLWLTPQLSIHVICRSICHSLQLSTGWFGFFCFFCFVICHLVHRWLLHASALCSALTALQFVSSRFICFIYVILTSGWK